MTRRGLLNSVALGACIVSAWASAPPAASAVDADADEATPIVKDVSYPEGAVFIEGKLYFVGYGDGTVNVWDDSTKKKTVLWQKENSGPCAVVPVGEHGDLLIACYSDHTLVRIDKDGHAPEPPLHVDAGPNDFAGDPKSGAVYFTTSGTFDPDANATGAVFYRDRSGEVRRLAKDIRYANGLALVDEGSALLVAETLNGRVLKFDVDKKTGDLQNRHVWRDLSLIRLDPLDKDWYTGPDGLKTDADGNIYICQFGAGRVLVTDSKGTLLRMLRVPYPWVTNVALDPEHREVAYVTAAQSAFSKCKDYGGAVFRVPNK